MYSPSLGLTDTDIRKEQLDISLGIGMLPETRPQLENPTHFGAFYCVGYGFFDNINLYFIGWDELNKSYSSLRRGFSLHSRISIIQNTKSRFEIIPRAAFPFDGSSANEYGFELACIYIYKINEPLYCYFGLGPDAGIHNFDKIKLDNSYGFGWIGYIGIGDNLLHNLRFVIEINPIAQFNS